MDWMTAELGRYLREQRLVTRRGAGRSPEVRS